MGGIDASNMLEMPSGWGEFELPLRSFRDLPPESGFLLDFLGRGGRCWCVGWPEDGVGGLELVAAFSAAGGVGIGTGAATPLGWCGFGCSEEIDSVR